MNCVVFLVASAIFCQIASSTPHVRQRRGYLTSHDDYPRTNGGSIIRPSWWSDPSSLTKPDNNGPKGYYDMFGEYHNGNSGEDSSEEDFKIKPLPNFGSYGSWREPSTTVPSPSYTKNYTPVKQGGSWWNGWYKTTTTTRSPPTQTTQQISTCVSSCPVTSEYNPVCGSNHITYPNPGRLECEQNCGVDVRLVRLSACSLPEANDKRNRSREEMVTCMRRCQVSENFSPVCGSNNITYENLQRLHCEQNCGISVKVIKMSPCSEPEPKPSPSTTEKIVKTEDQITACIKTSCSVTGEYKPVCGSNNVTYMNPERLECAQNCGVAVQLAKLTACSKRDSKHTTPTPTTPKAVNKEEQITACVRRCPVTGEYNPVCGSNNVTYLNPARLECAKNCGVVVQLTKYSACVVAESTTFHVNVELTSTTSSVLSSARPNINLNQGTTLNGGNHGYNENIANNNNNGIPDQLPLDNENSGNKATGNNGNNGYDGNIFNGNSGNAGNSEYSGSTGSDDKGGSSFDGGDYLINSCGGADDSYNKKKLPSVEEVTKCMQTCSLTSEYNPVCGTDNITYMNPGRLLCSQFCGIDVKVAKFAPCLSFNTIDYHVNHCITTCTNPSVTMTVNPGPVAPTPSLETCMNSCTTSSSYLPVCGTNNVTYSNLEKLQCARRCGIDVSLKRKAQCSASEDEPNPTPTFKPDSISKAVRACIKRCPDEQIFLPICGSDNFTYNNTKHLICVKRCGHNVGLKHLSACSVMLPTTPNPTSATEKVPKVTPGKPVSTFTISPIDILSIWPEEMTTENEDSVKYDIDVRALGLTTNTTTRY